MFLEIYSDKEKNNFNDQTRLTIEKHNNLHLDGDYPSNHFSSEGAENQACNSPPASDNDCSGYEKSTSNYRQCSGFKYQQLDETIGRPDEHTEVK